MEHRSSFSLYDAYEMYLLAIQSDGYTSDTLRFYKRLTLFMAWTEAEHLHEITPSTLRQFLLSLRKRNLSPHYIHSHARALRAWLNFCVNDDLIECSPFNKVAMPKLPKLPKRKPIILSDAEIAQAVTACQNTRDKLLLYLSLDCAARCSELVSANISDVDGHKLFIEDGKMQKDRFTFIGNTTKRLLLRYLIERGRPENSEPLFVSHKVGKRLTRSGLMQIYRRLRKSTGVTKLNSHTMRRTALSRMLKAGMSIYHVKEIAGHEDISILKYYINVDDDLEDAHSKFGVVDNL